MAKRYPLGSMLTAALLIAALITPGTAWGTSTGSGSGPTAPQRVSVIVQKADTSDLAEEMAVRLGGTVTKELSIINAFAVDLPTAAVPLLAASPAVRVVTPDSTMHKSGWTSEYYEDNWATAIGTSSSNGFTAAAQAADSAFGPNATYASGRLVSGAFGGFATSRVPGYAIKRVLVLLQLYVDAPMGPSEGLKVTMIKNGVPANDVVVTKSVFDPLVGSQNAAQLLVDVTPSSTWRWIDFEAPLEARITHVGSPDSATTVRIDAVGLRVYSIPGDDKSADVDNPSTAVKSAINTSALANVFNASINATKVWNSTGYIQGNGVCVAVVDSGIDRTRDLRARNEKNVNFNPEYHNGLDSYGHGTFVAGIAAGDGAASGGKYMGVAPKADYVNLRVSDDKGACSESDVVSALQWIYENYARYNIRVVNLSLNSDTAVPYTESPLDAACEILWFNGIVVVCSAGNNGTDTLYPPANDPFVITVGATDDKRTALITDDTVATFSAYGTTGAGTTKPEIVAPGRNIIGLLPENAKTTIGIEHPENRVDSTYFRMSGTSVSAPMVTGAVALLLQVEPNLTPDQVKYRLMYTANKKWTGYSSTKAGSGYLDCAAAVAGKTTASANTGIAASQLLWTGDTALTWDSVLWRSVLWRSVSWDSVMWRSVMWRSVMWRSDYWGL